MRPTPLLLLLLPFTASAASPPSSSLTGPTGALTWSVRSEGDGLRIDGVSPRWTVHHSAAADLRPLRTERLDADGARHIIVYDARGATVTGPAGELRIERPGLWDADTVDVRLGQLVTQGRDVVRFEAIDLAGPKVYAFQATVVESTSCGSQACTSVELTLTGVLRLVGPTWRFWYAEDGRLLRFEGPAGAFVAPTVAPAGGGR